jgi:hypothetical protein
MRFLRLHVKGFDSHTNLVKVMNSIEDIARIMAKAIDLVDEHQGKAPPSLLWAHRL